MQIDVTVQDANNILCEVTPPQPQIIVVDRGVEGNGIVSIVPVTISTFQYLRITYTNGTVQDVGPLTSTAYTATAPITIVGNTISLATVPIASGGTDATTAAGAIQNLLPSYTGNANKRLGLNSLGTALEWVLDGGGTVTSVAASGGTTGLTFTGSPITTSGTLTLGGTLAVANGGTGVTSSTGTGSVVLSTSPTLVTPLLGTPTSGNFSTGTFTWPTFNQNTTGTAANITATSNSTLTTLSALSLPGSQVSGNISGNAANVTGVVAIANGGTGQTTANAALNALLPTQTGNASKYLQTDGTNATWDAISLSTADITGILPTANGGTGLSSFTANGVVYASSSSALTTGSALTFDGTTFGLPTLVTSGTANIGANLYLTANALYYHARTTGGTNVRMLGINAGNTAYVGPIDSGPNDTILNASASSANIQFYASGSEQMRLTNTGLGIGVTSPAFKLDVGGQDGTNIALRSTGTSAARFRAYVNSAESGVIGFLNGGGQFFEVAGTEQMRLTSTGLGIGTSSPAYKLQVAGTAAQVVEFTSNATATAVRIDNTNASGWGGNLAFYSNGTGAGFVGTIGSLIGSTAQDITMWATSGNGVRFYTNGNNERMRVTSGGDVGIGTSTPTTKLDVIGGVRVGGMSGTTGNKLYFDTTSGAGANTIGTLNNYDLRIECGRGATSSFTAATNSLDFQIGGSEVGRFTSTGLGIGTSNPSYKLDIKGGTPFVNLQATVAGSLASPTLFGYQFAGYEGTVRASIQAAEQSQDTFNSFLTFSTYGGGANTERARITSGGSFLVNTTSSGTGIDTGSTQMFVVAPNSNFGAAITAVADSQGRTLRLTNQARNVIGVFDTGSSTVNIGANSTHPVTFLTSGVESARIDTSGQFLLGTTTSSGYNMTISGASSTVTGAKIINTSGSSSNLCLFATSSTYSGSFGVASNSGWLAVEGANNLTVGPTGAGAITFVNNSSERARIDSSGNFLLGNSANNGVIGLRSAGTLYIGGGNSNTNEIILQTGSSERARIDSSGNLLINTTSRTVASVASIGTLQVNNEIISIGSQGGFFWENRSGGVTSNTNWYGWYTVSGIIYLYNGSGNIASINTSSGAYTALSDQNKKKDFETSTIGLDAVMQLQPKLFRMIGDANDSPKQLGFVAQDVKEIIPQAYVEQSVVDAGNNNSTYIGLNDRPIIAALTKAIQEQQAIIDSLKARLDAANL